MPSNHPRCCRVKRCGRVDRFQCGRHYVVFIDAPLLILAAEADHLRHAIIE